MLHAFHLWWKENLLNYQKVSKYLILKNKILLEEEEEEKANQESDFAEKQLPKCLFLYRSTHLSELF